MRLRALAAIAASGGLRRVVGPGLLLLTAAACNLIIGLKEPVLVDSLDGGGGDAGDGGCAKDCLGGACVSGRCEPVALATKQSNPIYIAQSDDDVYWTDFLGNVVGRANKFDGGTGIFAGGTLADQPFGITADDAAVYFTNYGFSGTVVRCPFAGCTVQGIIYDAGTQGTAIVTNGNFVTWLQPFLNEIDRIPKNGGAVQTVASPDTANQYSDFATIATDGVYTYWSEPNTGTIKRKMVTGPTETVLANVGVTARIVLEQGTIYFVGIGSGNHDGTIGFGSASADAGTAQTISTTEQYPWGIAVDAQYIYWTTEGDYVSNKAIGNGGLYRAPKGGGTIETLASDLADPFDLVVDDRAIYFITSGTFNTDATIWRLAK